MIDQPMSPTPIDDDAAEHLVDAYNQADESEPDAIDAMPLPADLVAESDDDTLRLAVDGASEDDQVVLPMY